MTRTKITLTVLILVAMAVCSHRAQAQGRASAEYLIWHRDNGADQTLIGPSALSADEATFNFESGFRFSLGYGIGEWDVEAIFSQIPDWQADESTVLGLPLLLSDDPMDVVGMGMGTNTLGFPNGLTDAALSDPANVYSLDPGATAQFVYQSTLKDFQLNIGTNRTIRPYWAALGWRHVELDENSSLLVVGDFQSTEATMGGLGAALPVTAFTDIGFDGSGTFAGHDPMDAMATITTVTGLFQSVTDNDLDGGHIVLGGRFQPRDLVGVEVFLTAGLFQNRAEGTIVETIATGDGVAPDPDGILQRRLSNARSVASFVGGLGIRWIVPVTDYIFFRAGYEGLVITNLALAPEQSQGLGTTILGEQFYRVKTGGILFAHGANFGLGLTW